MGKTASVTLQSAEGLPGTYVWLGVGLLVFVLSMLAFAYLATIRSKRVAAWIRHPVLGRMDAMLSAHAPRFWRFVRARFTIGEWHGLALTIGILAFALGAYVFALIVESWTDQAALYLLDQRVSSWLHAHMGPGMTALMVTVTRFGDSEVVTALSATVGLALLYRRYAWHVLTLMLAPGLGSAAVVGFKTLFARTRPTVEAAAELGHSFPSGHAFAAITFYGLMVYLVWRHVRSDWIRIPLTILFVVIVVLVALSRIMLRVHWVSDVIGGLTLGLAWLICSIVLTHALKSVFGRTARAHRLAPDA
ncbi:MAG TPA: phosphatase PAP2 family protein [Rhodothermales bacterium]